MSDDDRPVRRRRIAGESARKPRATKPAVRDARPSSRDQSVEETAQQPTDSALTSNAAAAAPARERRSGKTVPESAGQTDPESGIGGSDPALDELGVVDSDDAAEPSDADSVDSAAADVADGDLEDVTADEDDQPDEDPADDAGESSNDDADQGSQVESDAAANVARTASAAGPSKRAKSKPEKAKQGGAKPDKVKRTKERSSQAESAGSPPSGESATDRADQQSTETASTVPGGKVPRAKVQGAKAQSAKAQGAKVQGAKAQGAKIQGAKTGSAKKSALEGSESTGVKVAQDTAAPHASRNTMRRSLQIVAAVLAGALAIGTSVWAFQQIRAGSQLESRQKDAAQAAAEAAETILSYRYDQLDEHLSASQKLMTPEFGKEFASLSPALNDLAPQRRIVVKATARDAATTACGSDCSGDKADVLIFIDQARLEGREKQPTVFGNRITLSMVRSDGKWLVSDLDAF